MAVGGVSVATEESYVNTFICVTGALSISVSFFLGVPFPLH